MLQRLVILNSTLYGKANIRFDDGDSIQLVGPNNIGKSTLVFALNFLFIIDGKRMTFVDNKPGDKDTFHHYFPSAVSSYIIFEIFKQRHYCILLKRSIEGELEYYRIDHAYKEEFFTKSLNNQNVVQKFDELLASFVAAGIKVEPFKDKREVFNFVYQRGKKNNGVVWLENSVLSDGLSNNFSKIYKYLINSKLVTNKILKEALIIADNRDKEVVNFSPKSKSDINDLLRINEEIKSISAIQLDFANFREVRNQYHAKGRILAEMVFAFNQQYQPTYISLETQRFQKKDELDQVRIELNERLNPDKQKLDREIGGKNIELRQIAEKQKELQIRLDEIKSFEPVEFLTLTVSNLDDRRKQIESGLTRTQALTVREIEKRISELNADNNRLGSQIQGYSNQLIHRITSNKKNRELLNFILSEEFSSLPSELVEEEVKNINAVMKLFDGQIKIPTALKGKTIASIEELRAKLEGNKKELEDIEKLLPIARDFEKTQKELTDLTCKLEEAKDKIRKIESGPLVEEQLKQQAINFVVLSDSIQSLEKQLSVLNEQIVRKSGSIPVLTDAIKDIEKRLEKIKGWKIEVEKISLEPIETDTELSFDDIYNNLMLIHGDRLQLKINKDKVFENIKFRIKSLESDEDVFIRFVEDEIACLSDKERSVKTILQAISTQFANPAYNLLKRYGEFKEFITNRFNAKLSKTKISNIESLRIVLSDGTRTIDDLKKISSIQEIAPQTNFDFDNSDNLKILNNYLDAGRKIEFEELFDIELHLIKDGKEKTVDLKNQVESTGTDIMIRMVIIMSVINKLAISDKNNKIAIAIDEIARVDGKNRIELFKFCKEHNFIPICTSTEETMLDGFEKYVMLFPPSSGKVNVSDASPNVIKQEMTESHD